MKSSRFPPPGLLPGLLLSACGLLLGACGQSAGGSEDGDPGRKWKTDFAVPVRVAPPGRGEVEDYVETQATLESDRRADVHARIEGEIVERLRDVGDRITRQADGGNALLLARIDDRDVALALKEAEIQLKQRRGALRQLAVERERAEKEVEQAQVSLREAEALLKRTTSGITDGTLSIEEHETAQFGRSFAEAKELAAQSSLERAEILIELGGVAIEEAEVARDRAKVAADRASIRAPFEGIVTVCEVRQGERVTKGQLLYRIEDPASLVVYGAIPVRQAYRVRVGNPVRIDSTATPAATAGHVVLVAPTVDRESGTVRVKVRVDPAEGYKPGLFITMKIVVESRSGALVVPKRAVLHHDEDGAFLFLIRDGKAVRTLVRTGFQSETSIEILEGILGVDEVVVEGQDTLSDGARVDVILGDGRAASEDAGPDRELAKAKAE